MLCICVCITATVAIPNFLAVRITRQGHGSQLKSFQTWWSSLIVELETQAGCCLFKKALRPSHYLDELEQYDVLSVVANHSLVAHHLNELFWGRLSMPSNRASIISWTFLSKSSALRGPSQFVWLHVLKSARQVTRSLSCTNRTNHIRTNGASPKRTSEVANLASVLAYHTLTLNPCRHQKQYHAHSRLLKCCKCI